MRISARTSFHFPAKAEKQLVAIQRRSRLANGADVIRAALSVYDDLLEVTVSGHKIVIRDQNGKDWPFSPYSPFNYPGLATEIESELESQIEDNSLSEKGKSRNFFFSGDAVTRLESIRNRTHIQNNSDVIRIALNIYNELISVFLSGDRIFIHDNDGREHFYTPFAPLNLSAQPEPQPSMPPVKTARSPRVMQPNL